MEKYSKLDSLILAQMNEQPKAFEAIFVGEIRRECEAIAKLETVERSREIETFRILDRRLQAFRKAQKIWHNGKGWLADLRNQVAR